MESAATSTSNGLNYFFLSLLFIVIIGFVIFIWIFSKWLTVGPKMKKKFNNLGAKIKRTNKNKTLTSKKGHVIVANGYVESLDQRIIDATTPQELLEAQNARESFEKEKTKALNAIKDQEEIKFKKQQDKEEAEKYKAEIKAESEKIKKKLKEKKENE